MAKITVLGANGFIGRHLVNRLAAHSAHKIVAFDKFSSYRQDAQQPFREYGNVLVQSGNFYNREDVAAALKGASYVFHLVSTTTPATSHQEPMIDIDTNVRGSIELFELCAEAGIKKVIFISSGGTVYGDIDSDKISEATLPQPRSPYGIGKLTIEHYLRYFKFISGTDYIIYRAANPYGPGQNIQGKQGVIPIFMYKFLRGEPITIYGKGDMVRDYVYIDDLINMIAGSYQKNNKHAEYNLGSGEGVTVNQIVDAVESCTGKVTVKKHITTPATFTQKSVLDITRFTEEFGITPSISLKKGITRTWQHVKKIG